MKRLSLIFFINILASVYAEESVESLLAKYQNANSAREFIKSINQNEYDVRHAATDNTRSLQKGKGRRHIYVIQKKDAEGSAFREANLIFMGIAENSSTSEIIEVNGISGETRFLEMKSDVKPWKIIQPNIEKCISCHQSRGPHLTGAPWREFIAFTSNGREEERIPGLSAATVSNSDIEKTLSVDAIDGDVRRANQLIQMRNICDSILLSSTEIMNLYLKAVIFFMANDSADSVNGFGTALNIQSASTGSGSKGRKNLIKALSTQLPSLEELNEKLQKIWPKDEFAYTSDILADRRIVNGRESVFRSLATDSGKDITFNRPSLSLATVRDIYDVMEMNPELAKKLADPSTPRPKINSVSSEEGLFILLNNMDKCLGVSKNEFKELINLGSKIDFKKVSSDPRLSEISEVSFESKKFPRIEQLINIVRDNLVEERDLTQVIATRDHSEETKFKGRALLRKYCVECHGPGEEGVLPLDESLAQYRVQRPKYKGLSVSDIVKESLMPKGKAKENLQINPQDLQDMTDFLKPND